MANVARQDNSKIEILKQDAGEEDDRTSMTFIFHEEDHTIGNVLKHIISKYPEVEFCGYNVPHPLEDKILFRIQTKPGHSAIDFLKQGLVDVQNIFAHLRTKFENSLEQYEETINESPEVI